MDAIPTVLVAIFLSLLLRRLTRKSLHLPPGPRPLPIIGNLLDMPSGASWTAFSSMSKLYGKSWLLVFSKPNDSAVQGDIMHLRVLNQPTIILSSLEATNDLFEKRSTIYSDRYHSVSLTDLWVLSCIMFSYSLWRLRSKDGRWLVFCAWELWRTLAQTAQNFPTKPWYRCRAWLRYSHYGTRRRLFRATQSYSQPHVWAYTLVSQLTFRRHGNFLDGV